MFRSEFKRVWGEREGYVIFIKQLTSPQVILPSGEFNCVRKRCNYGLMSVSVEPAKVLCISICTKRGPTVWSTKSRLIPCIKPGYMWDPWRLQPGLLQKKILMRAAAVLIIGICSETKRRNSRRSLLFFYTLATPSHFCFHPKSSLKTQSQIQSPS